MGGAGTIHVYACIYCWASLIDVNITILGIHLQFTELHIVNGGNSYMVGRTTTCMYKH